MIEKILRNSLVINSIVVFSIFLIDRISKIYVISLDKKFLGSEIFSSKFLNIYLVWNEGIAFGLFSSNDSNFYNIITFLIILIIIILFYMITQSQGLQKYSLFMILGGAIGNAFDRILYKSVPDFIDFHVNEFHWFIFNVADIFITIGVICMILTELIASNKKKNEDI
jgi:signal peptidase II